ncbi:MAG: efflux RND transporter periplasmic adaptor subunit [Pseudomonadota bacterium]
MGFVWRAIKELFWLAVAIAVIAGGWFGFQYLGETRTVVEAEPVERSVPIVETAPIQTVESGIPITANGFVAAGRLLDIAAEAGGRIVELHPAIDARGTFQKGDTLFRLDDRSAQASIAQIEATIESTVAQLELVETQLTRAQALRERGVIAQEQLDQAQTSQQELRAALRNLEANLEAVQVASENTVVAAPFDGRVLSKEAELGAVISQGAPVAQIYADDLMEVSVELRESEASLIPGLLTDPQATAYVESDFAGTRYRWDAQIARVDREIDAATRTIGVTLALTNPDQGMPVDGQGAGEVPALINAFVNVTIEALPSERVYAVDVNTVGESGEIWTLEGNVIRAKPVTVLQRSGTFAYIAAEALSSETQLVTTAMSSPLDGMEVAVAASVDPTQTQPGG